MKPGPVGKEAGDKSDRDPDRQQIKKRQRGTGVIGEPYAGRLFMSMGTACCQAATAGPDITGAEPGQPDSKTCNSSRGGSVVTGNSRLAH